MSQSTFNLISDDLLAQAIRLWGGERENLTFVREFANIVYRYEREGQKAILRLTHSSHRSAVQVQAELEWINFLVAQGLTVCAPLPRLDGEWLVELPVADGSLTAVLWEHAPGGPPQAANFGPELYRQMGQLLGQMHRLSRDYEPVDPLVKRPDWAEDESSTRLSGGFTAEDEAIREGLERIWALLAGWDRGRDVYHLIHGDVHAGNMFLHEGQIHLFDFDDCCYHWRIYDLANALYYVLWRVPRTAVAQRTALAQEFMPPFLAGYRQEQTLSADWLAQIPLLLEYRDLVVYAYVRGMVQAIPEHEGLRQLLQLIRGRVEANEPYVYWELPVSSF